MRPSRLVISGLLMSGVVGFFAMPLLANSIILSSQLGREDPKLGIGKRLPDGTAIILRAGEVVKLLDRTGTRTLKGPGKFQAGVSVVENDRVGKAVNHFTDQSRTARVAALRSGPVAKSTKPALRRAPRAGYGGGGSGRLPPLWKLIQSGQSGNFCFTGGQRMMIKNLSRAGTPGLFTLTYAATDEPIELLGYTGAPVFQIAKPFFPTDGTKLRLNDVVVGITTEIELKQMSIGEGDLVSQYSALDALGCTAQRDLLVAGLDSQAD